MKSALDSILKKNTGFFSIEKDVEEVKCNESGNDRIPSPYFDKNGKPHHFDSKATWEIVESARSEVINLIAKLRILDESSASEYHTLMQSAPFSPSSLRKSAEDFKRLEDLAESLKNKIDELKPEPAPKIAFK